MEPIPIRFGGYQPPTSVHHRAADVFGHALAARLGDAVAFHLDGNVVAAGHQAVDLLRFWHRWSRRNGRALAMTSFAIS